MNSISVTKNAWKKMDKILKQTGNKYGFLYSASSGGCSGFNFELKPLESNIYKEITSNRFHTVLNEGTTKLYIDPVSEMYLLGTSVDYISEDYKKNIYESKFIFNIESDLINSCGCGKSFNIII